MIQIRGLQKSYKAHPVLCGLNMTVERGEVYGFIGRNGSGKSTTMNILAGLLARDGGEVTIDGRQVTTGQTVTVGYLPEEPALLEYMNAWEYLEYIAAASGFTGDIQARSTEVLGLVGLTDAADRKIGGYSRGMKQRAGMAAALYSDHEVIILDEPTSALDPQGRAEVMQIIQIMRALGKTVLLSTHILSDVERIADRVGILNNGVLAEEDTLQNLLTKYSEDSIQFELSKPDDTLKARLEALGFVTRVEQSAQRYLVWTTGRDETQNQAIFRFLADADTAVSHYQLQKATLEQVYLKVVGGNAV